MSTTTNTSHHLIHSLLHLSRQLSLLSPSPSPLLLHHHRHVSSISRKFHLLSLLFEELFSQSPPRSLPPATSLIHSLLHLSRQLSLLSPSPSPLLLHHHRHVSSISRKFHLLSLLFEELFSQSPPRSLPPSTSLVLPELLSLLRSFHSLLSNCSARSNTLLLLQPETVSDGFHQLTLDLSLLLSLLPISNLSDDVRDIVHLLCRQCRRSTPDPSPDGLRTRILNLIHQAEMETVPDNTALEGIFRDMGLTDARSCQQEMEALEREIGGRVCERWREEMVAMAAVVRYAKCVLFGEDQATESDGDGDGDGGGGGGCGGVVVPDDFRCPISLELMKDPVVAASGQTYDREAISRWIGSGHATCPKTGQGLVHLDLVPNRAVKNLIAVWCREQNIPFDLTESGKVVVNTVNKAELGAARMTADFLVRKLTSAAAAAETVGRVVGELRRLAKDGVEVRGFIGEAGAIPVLVPLMFSEEGGLQVNAVTALLNLSLVESNKRRIAHVDGIFDGVIHVLLDGATCQAKENAAALVASLSEVHSYRRRFGRNHHIVAALVSLVKMGPVSTKKDALNAILSLAGDRENIRRMIENGVVDCALEAVEDAEVADEAVAIVAALARRGGAEEVGEKEGVVLRLVRVLRCGSDAARENAAAALVILCRNASGRELVADVARVAGIEWVIWEMMGSGTERGRRKAASLGRMCRRWVEAAEEAQRAVRFSSSVMGVAASAMTQS